LFFSPDRRMAADMPPMNWMPVLLLLTNVLTIAWALRLLGRRPNRRLRHLVLTVSIVSMTQTVAFLCHLQGRSLLQAAIILQQCVTSMGAMAAVYLLWIEVRDRNRTDHLLRLAEHESRVRQSRLGVKAPRGSGTSGTTSPV
jgi:hypothetical protein